MKQHYSITMSISMTKKMRMIMTHTDTMINHYNQFQNENQKLK